jgi:hypothetical protein
MFFRTLQFWLRTRHPMQTSPRRRKRPPAKRRPAFVPRLTVLEDRTLPSTFTVVNLNDSGPGSLRDAIADANANLGPDTIVFKHGLHGTIPLTSGELLISDSVIINGPSADQIAVSGSNASRVFEIAASLNVTINGLTITHGYATDNGGGILNDGGNLALSADNFTQNAVLENTTNGGAGGGISSLGGNLAISNCQVTNNQALGAAGASASGNASGGGIYLAAGTASISDSSISNNLARGGDNSLFGLAEGGGMYLGALVNVTDCSINNNVARAGDDTSNSPALNSFALGGGLFINVSSTTLGSCTLDGNRAVGGNGGTGQFVGGGEGGAINNYASLTITGSTFVANQARGGSGGSSGPSYPGPFVDYAFGGAIANTFASLTISGSRFSFNAALGGNNSTGIGTDIIGAGGAESGAVYSEVGATASISGSVVDDNVAQGGSGNSGTAPVVLVGEGLGGGIANGYGGSGVGPDTFTITNTAFNHNAALGGDINTGAATVSGLVGTGVGAGIGNYVGGTITISGSPLTLNQARGGHDNTASGSGIIFAGFGAGGAIFNYLSNFNSSVYGPLGASAVTVTGCGIALNLAEGNDGGTGAGGGIANVLGATTTVSSTALTLNLVDGDGSGAGLGGGAYNDATSSLALTRCQVTFNVADGTPGIGGGVYTVGTFTDALTVIMFNFASTSGDNIGP